MNMIVARPDHEAPALTGLAPLARIVFRQDDVAGHLQAVHDRAMAEDGDAGAIMDLAMLLQLTGNGEQGLAAQTFALSQSRLFRRSHGDGEGLRLLVFVVAGDFMANTPLDFMLEDSDMTVHYLYVDETLEIPPVPDHDLAFLAIGESEVNNPVLARMPALLAGWPRPVVNAHPERIANLSRVGVWETFRQAGRVIAPIVVRAPRGLLQGAVSDAWILPALLAGADYPVIIRPIGSHAGIGLEKVDDGAALAAYLAGRQEATFYVSPFIDYSSDDGRFRKYRIAFIDGRPFLGHMAISDHWMVHYLNAGMQEDPAKRAEEAACMATFDAAFVADHAADLKALSDGLNLAYFAVDCALMRDGRLLLFEADVAMILHAMDPPDLYPYKAAPMKRLFDAFQAMLAAAAG